MQHRWNLYVDESGDFEAGDEAVIVAGWLVHSENPAARPAELRCALGRLAPDPLWPFHTAHLNVPATWALGALAALDRGDRLPSEGGLPDLAEVGQSFVRAIGAGPLRGLLDRARLSPASLNGWQDLRALDGAWRSTDPARHGDAGRWSSAYSGRMAELLRATGGARVNQADSILVAAAESEPGDAVRPPRGRVEDRYMGLLACLLQRLGALLDRVPGDHRVEAAVLGRRVRQRKHQEALTSEVVERLVRRVCRPPSERVDLDVTVHAWTHGATPGLVVADFVANRARRILCRPQRLSLVERSAAALTGLRARVGRPALAATGAPWAWIADRAERIEPTPMRSTTRRWTTEQALEWGVGA